MTEPTQTTLRDTISAAFDAAETSVPAEPSTPASTIPTSPSQEDVGTQAAGETEQQKIDRRKTREHGADGKFLPRKDAAPQASALPETASPPAVPDGAAPVRPPRPQSWKKEYWDHWEKLDPQLASYLIQREGEYAKGVSTYKQEWDRAKPFLEAVAPYQQELAKYGIDPAQQFGRYVEIHRGLAMGNPQQKLQMLAQIARDYQIPLQGLLVRGQDGQVYFNQQLLQQHAQPRAPQVPDVNRIVEERINEMLAKQQTQAFIAAKDASGNPAHPHFEQVQEQMAQLLDAGVAEDLDDAYQKALKLNDDLWSQVQEQQRQQQEAEKQRKVREDAERARRQAVQVRGETPAGTPAGAKKGLRSAIESAFDQHAGGRV